MSHICILHYFEPAYKSCHSCEMVCIMIVLLDLSALLIPLISIIALYHYIIEKYVGMGVNALKLIKSYY